MGIVSGKVLIDSGREERERERGEPTRAQRVDAPYRAAFLLRASSLFPRARRRRTAALHLADAAVPVLESYLFRRYLAPLFRGRANFFISVHLDRIFGVTSSAHFLRDRKRLFYRGTRCEVLLWIFAVVRGSRKRRQLNRIFFQRIFFRW